MVVSTADKYLKERSKHLRSRVANQYATFQSVEGRQLDTDPYADYDRIARENPRVCQGHRTKFLIVGAGHSGLLFAYRLIEAGYRSSDILMIDNAGGFGGTWYWNRYPGVGCDVESSIYLPLLEEMNYTPKHRYAFGYEIREHAERIGKALNLRAMFHKKVVSQMWDDGKGVWKVQVTHSSGADTGPPLCIDAQFVFGGWGYFYSPQVPRLPGLGGLGSRVKTFHTARWDYEYTGGTQENPRLVNLKGKRVGIVGTGATGVQLIPEVAKWAGHLYVFQRTPSYCFPRARQTIDPHEWATKVASSPGWQYRRQDNFERLITDDPSRTHVDDLIGDGWTANAAYAAAIGSRRHSSTGSLEQRLSDMLQADEAAAATGRSLVDERVSNAKTANKLKPWYPGWCKRPTFHDGYLSAFNQANVTLVDTNGRGIERYTDSGLVANGVPYELDCLILATGFAPSSSASPAQRMGGTIVGRGGRSIADKWNAPDFGTLHGVMTHHFPNMFFYAVAGVGSSPNLTPYYDTIARLASHVVRAAAARRPAGTDGLVIEPTKPAEDSYTDEVARRSHWFRILDGCTPGYYNGEAAALLRPLAPAEATLRARRSGWGGGPVEYRKRVYACLADGDKALHGLEIRQVVPTPSATPEKSLVVPVQAN